MPAVLRPLDVERDSPFLHEIFGDPEGVRYLDVRPCPDLAATRALMERWTVGYEKNSWAITDGVSDEALGRVATFPTRPDVWGVGIMMRPCARGRGLATNAVGQAVRITFERDGARRIFADIDPENTASVRIFERLGFHREGVLRAEYETHAGVRDALIMSLVRGDAWSWREPGQVPSGTAR